jgi:hypothetical protein
MMNANQIAAEINAPVFADRIMELIRANHGKQGLAAQAFGRSLNRALGAVLRLESGQVHEDLVLLNHIL